MTIETPKKIENILWDGELTANPLDEVENETARRLATIARIEKIEPIIFTNSNGVDEVAANIEKATVRGWHLVVKKNEFKVNDLCLYLEIDSLISKDMKWIQFLVNPTKPKDVRIKSKRMCGVISQGLALPLNAVFEEVPFNDSNNLFIAFINNEQYGLAEDTDVTHILNIKKYVEHQFNSNSTQLGRIKSKGYFPSFLIKTDSERVQNNWKYINSFFDREWYATIKEDGTSATFYLNNNIFGVCSRNLELHETDDNVYWKITKKYNIEETLRKYSHNIAIQGEIVGPSIQGNKMKLEEIEYHIYDVYDIDANQYYDYNALINFATYSNLKTVPIYKEFSNINNLTVDEFVEMATIKDPYDKYGWIEGLVFRPKNPLIINGFGRVAAKAINPEFLLSTGT